MQLLVPFSLKMKSQVREIQLQFHHLPRETALPDALTGDLFIPTNAVVIYSWGLGFILQLISALYLGAFLRDNLVAQNDIA